MKNFIRRAVICVFCLTMTPALAQSGQEAGFGGCKFKTPTQLLKDLRLKYIRYRYFEKLSLLDYLWNIPKEEKKRLYLCGDRLFETKAYKALPASLKPSLHFSLELAEGPDIEGGDFSTDDLTMVSICQMHSCISNIHSDIFDREGNLIGIILFLYPMDTSDPSSSPAGQQLADHLLGHKTEAKYPLEAWIAVRKESNTPEMQAFLKEALAHFQKGSGATITSIHDLSD